MEEEQLLVVRAGGHACGLKVGNVIEVLRPQPLETVSDMPAVALGLSLIRGTPTLVVDLAAVFGANARSPGRLVLARTGERKVALAVDEVVGIRQFEIGDQEMPPLLRDAASGAIESIKSADAELLFLLQSTNIVPEEVLARLTSG